MEATISPTRRSPRDLPTRDIAARERVIPERPPEAQIALAHHGIRNNDLATLRRAIAACKGGWFGNGVYLLHFAANNGASAECIDLLMSILVAEETSIDKYNDQHRSALYCACEHNHLAAATKLVQLGAKLETCDSSGNTPLNIAVTKNYHRIATMLLDNGANIHAITEGRSTPLHRAAGNGALECVKLLLDRGAILDCKNLKSMTPLQLARVHNQTEVVEYLEGLNNGDDNEAEDPSPTKKGSPKSSPSTKVEKKSSPPKKSTPKSSPSTKPSPKSSPKPSPKPSPKVSPKSSNNNNAKDVDEEEQEVDDAKGEKREGEIKQEPSHGRVKRMRVDDEVSFRCGSPFSPIPTPPPEGTNTTTSTASSSSSPLRRSSPLVKPEAVGERIMKIKRKEDDLFWEIRVPAYCTFSNFVQIIAKKTGLNVVTIAKGNVRVVDDDDVSRLPSDCELTLVV